MSRLSRWLGRGKKAGAGPPPSVPLPTKFARYKDLLAANSAILNLIADMQKKLAEGFLFDMHYVRTSTGDLSAHVSSLVGALIEMTGGRYRALEAAREAAEARMRERLSPPQVGPGPLGYPLESIPPGAFQAGGKAEKLGRLAAAGLSVPAGFVVTAWAQRLFFEVPGRLMMVSNQMDMLMFSDAAAEHYAKEFIAGGYSLSL